MPESATREAGRLRKLMSRRPSTVATTDRVRPRAAALRVAGVTVAIAIVVAAALGARSLANSDAAGARRSFQGSSSRASATVSLALQREEDLTVAASTFLAAHPNPTSDEYATWARFARVTARYPEVRRLDVIALVPALPVKVSAKDSLTTDAAVASTGSTGSTGVLAGAVKTRCLLVAGLSHVPTPSSASRDLCSRGRALLTTRDSGRPSYARVSVHGHPGLEAITPVYRAGTAPAETAARRAMFAGWLRAVVEPTVVLERALAGQTDLAMRLRHRGAGAAFETTFATTPGSGQLQSAAFKLHGGWSLRALGAPADATVFGNSDAAALLIGGTLLGLLLIAISLLAPARGGREERADAPREDGRPEPGEELYDQLTGLPNRALTMDRAQRMIARGGRESGVLAGALMIDIDWFADINERFGAAAGDRVLRAVADRLHGTMRAVDSIGRVGGDQFVVLVEASRGIKFDAVARRVIEALHEPIDVEGFGPSFVITASVGVAFGRYRSVEDLLADARLALVSAKSAGKDRYTLFNANMRSVIEGRGVLEGELSAALSEGGLYLEYEPIRDLRTNAIVGFEALVRWKHPERGVMPAEEFASLAEDSGLVVPVGRFALEEACTRAAEWNLSERRIAVAAKVSATQLHRDGFITDVRRALQLSGLEPALLTLEIEETTAIDDLEGTRARFAQLRALGVSIAIDNFGNGYAFRSDLQSMPIDCIKVDRESLAESEGDDYRNWLLEAILSFGRDLSTNVIATGVRHAPQLGAVYAMGFPMAQGPAVGEPVAATQVQGLLDAPAPAPDALAPPPPLTPLAAAAGSTHPAAVAHATSAPGAPNLTQPAPAPQATAATDSPTGPSPAHPGS